MFIIVNMVFWQMVMSVRSVDICVTEDFWEDVDACDIEEGTS
jgi:hypothetical protein